MNSFTEEDDSHYYKITALSLEVLVVASITKVVNEWSAYIGICNGPHKQEWKLVKQWGTKLFQDVAEAIFPAIAKEYRWRD